MMTRKISRLRTVVQQGVFAAYRHYSESVSLVGGTSHFCSHNRCTIQFAHDSISPVTAVVRSLSRIVLLVGY